MDAMYLLESLSRWIHVVAGIFWIGMLYFFNFVNANFAPTLDPETRKKVVPELMPRALYWFRWGAAFTWVTGVLILLIVFYHGRAALEAGREWSLGAFAMLILVFLAPFIYDLLYKAIKDPTIGFVVGVVLSATLLYLYQAVGFGFRGYSIHLGATMGTVMAFNVWFRIWPAQRSIITAIKNGQAPDAALVALAGTRSKHNTYMSFPLVFMMLAQHATWAASPITLTIVVVVAWAIVYHLYDRSKNVKGF